MKMRCSRQEIIDEDKVQQVAECVAEDKLEEVADKGWILSKGDVCKRVSEAKPAHHTRRRAQRQHFECQMGNERLMRSMRGYKEGFETETPLVSRFSDPGKTRTCQSLSNTVFSVLVLPSAVIPAWSYLPSLLPTNNSSLTFEFPMYVFFIIINS
ncbi:hypothetical protein EDB19DRAFT_1715309 [Suillus lakei]|nr:hypothetical protein EDB19DRAFT_1715309 [Suillus lakei]